MNWISVKDRLPNQYQRVLVTDGNATYQKMYEDGIFYGGETHCYCPIGRIEGITHWMPLPPPPNE